jgi:hypothetical protein
MILPTDANIREHQKAVAGTLHRPSSQCGAAHPSTGAVRMYIVREVMHCRPGKVRDMVSKFTALNAVMKRKGYPPFRIFTDVSGERFWTIVLESETDNLEEHRRMEENVLADPEAQKAMSGYHDIVDDGRRAIYKIEA